MLLEALAPSGDGWEGCIDFSVEAIAVLFAKTVLHLQSWRFITAAVASP